MSTDPASLKKFFRVRIWGVPKIKKKLKIEDLPPLLTQSEVDQKHRLLGLYLLVYSDLS